MRLLSLNAWGGRLIEPLLDYLAQADADIICLQEVTHALEPSPKRLLFRGGNANLEQQSDLFEEVSALLPDHSAAFFPAAQGQLRDQTGQSYWSQFGLATFVRKNLSIIDEREAFVHGEFNPEGWGEPPAPRNVHMTRLCTADSAEFCVVQLHGLRVLTGKTDSPERTEQAEKLVRYVTEFADLNGPIILCGDLNLLPDSETFDRLRTIGLVDLITKHGISDTRTSWYKKSPRYADYTLINDAVRLSHFEVVKQPEVSDHCAMLTDFEVSNAR